MHRGCRPLRLDLAHLFGQRPKRAIEAHAAINAGHRPGLNPAALDAAACQPAADHVFLHTLQRALSGKPVVLGSSPAMACHS